MDERDGDLSEQAATILSLIAEGRGYEQILQRHPALTYFDIFAAAREVLDLLQSGPPRPSEERPLIPHREHQRADPLGKGPARAVSPECGEQARAPEAHVEPPAPAGPMYHGATTEQTSDGAAPPGKRLPAHIERARKTHPRAWARWTRDDDAELTTLFHQGAARSAIEQQLGRQPGAITGRLLKLGLISEDGAEPPQPARDVQRTAPEAVEPHHRPAPTAPPSVVPGWETLRDRLSPDEEPF